MPEKRPSRFLTPALKLGGRGQWRIERAKLEEFIARAYEQTAREIAERGTATDGDEEDYAHDLDYRQEGGEG